MNASLREIVLAVRYGDASLVGESVGYLILGACDRAVAVPRSVDLDGVLVTGEGDVVLDATPVSEDEAERSLRYLLGQLLTLLRTPFPNLARVATRDACGLGHLVTELEAALVPVNRRAARRSLSRLVRETRRSLAKEHLHAAVVDVTPAPAALRAQVAALPDNARHFAPEPRTAEAAPLEFALPPAGGPAWDVDVSWIDDGQAEEVQTHTFQASDVQSDDVQSDDVQHAAAWAGAEQIEQDQAESDWVDEVPSLIAGLVTPLGPGAPRAEWAPRGDADDSSGDPPPIDDFDEALTRVTTAVETLPPPAIAQRSAFNMRRLVTTAELEGPLLPTLASGAQSPSSIQDLLHRMRLEGQQPEVVLAGLALLARVDLSPPAPPVG